ncbi:MAG TPA: NTP transferase domain-containing protein [Xanthomonadaceae bacterium]|nr:NTP transferase domain-containing protein [Xanthomonadaceae bacterium]
MKTVAFLPAKGNSDRIGNKNVRLLDGKPLFLHTLDKLLACDFIDEVCLDTESEEIAAMAAERDCRVLMRDPKLASNATDGNRLFMNQVRQVEADIYIQALCTSPFIEPDTMRRGVEALAQPGTAHDSAVLVRKERLYTWRDGRPTYDIANIPNSFTLDETVIETMGLYIVRRDAALRLERRIGDQPLLLEASPLEAVDVNWPEDFALAELIEAGRRERDRCLLNNLKALLSSPMLSDILDDHGYPDQVIRGLAPNLPDVRMLGRAKTLRLRKLEDGEDFRGIYKALDSYATVVPNDVIVVENEIGQYAYFGELNANLAIRRGAAGVVVGGMTRDSADVVRLGLPVFAQGYSCQDVRKRATLDSVNKPVTINGVRVAPEDLVFGDREGLVVIPRRVEASVLDAALRVATNEKRILIDISEGAEVERLTREYGFF